MSKRLLTFITIVPLLAVFSVAQAQDTPRGEPILVLTEKQINEEFSIPSTATRQISDLEVDVKEDGVYISFQMTVIRDGTSNTLGIIAILIGLVQADRTASGTETVFSSSIVNGPEHQQLNNLVLRAWNSYLNTVRASIPADHIHMLLGEEAIYYFAR